MSEEKLTRAAVVTGGSRGIGRAVCVALAKQGCNVVVNYCHGEAAAAETAALCKELGVEAVTVQADVSTAEGCKKLFEEAVNAFGRVDILVNNAGVTRDNLILRLTEEDFDAVLEEKRVAAAKEAEAFAQQQRDAAKAQADKILSDAKDAAESERQKIVAEANREAVAIAEDAMEKLMAAQTAQAYDAFVNAAEEEQNEH